MKIHIQKDILEKNLLLVQKVVNNNHQNPALRGVKCTMYKNQITLEATNIEMSVSIQMIGKCDGDGVVLIPLKTLLDVVRYSFGEIVIVFSDQVATITSGKSVTKISLLSHEEFPPLPQKSTESPYILKTTHILQGLNSVLYAVSQSTIKPELASVSIYTDDVFLVFVGTDSFRLAEKKIPFEGDRDFPSILIPSKNAHELVGLLTQLQEESLTLFIEEDMCTLSTELFQVTTRLISGVFPDYKKIIPKDYTTESVLLKEDLIVALKKMSVVADVAKQIHMDVSPTKGYITVTSKSSTIGEVEDTLEGTLQGQDLSLNFNQRYILDCFQSIPVDSIHLGFGGQGRPLVITGVSDRTFVYLVMPMNK